MCVRTILKVNILRKIDSKVRNLAAYFDFSFSFAESCGKKTRGGSRLRKGYFVLAWKLRRRKILDLLLLLLLLLLRLLICLCFFPVFFRRRHIARKQKKRKKSLSFPPFFLGCSLCEKPENACCCFYIILLRKTTHEREREREGEKEEKGYPPAKDRHRKKEKCFCFSAFSGENAWKFCEKCFHPEKIGKDNTYATTMPRVWIMLHTNTRAHLFRPFLLFSLFGGFPFWIFLSAVCFPRIECPFLWPLFSHSNLCFLVQL